MVHHTFLSGSPWSPWSDKQAASHFAVKSERPNFARLCAFRLVKLAEGLSYLRRRRRKFAVCVRSEENPLPVTWKPCSCSVVWRKEVDILGLFWTKQTPDSHWKPTSVIKKPRWQGLLATHGDKVCWPPTILRSLSLMLDRRNRYLNIEIGS